MILDFHNHLIPGVDDGARDTAEARSALQQLREQGVEALIATPHVDASLSLRKDALEARLSEIDVGWERLRSAAAQVCPAADLRRGAEVMLDTPEPDLAEPRLRLDGGRMVLVEFPHLTVPPGSVRVIGSLVRGGWVTILAHPERYIGITDDIEIAGDWRRAGAYLQVNSASLLGRYGKSANRIALELLGRGWADYLASDYHARGRPVVAEAQAALAGLGAEEQARLLLETNPARILSGEAPLPVPPLPVRRTLWQRLSARRR